MKHLVYFIAIICASNFSSHAQIIDASSCVRQSSESERLKCYDNLSKKAKDESKIENPTTKEVVQSQSFDPAKIIDAEDMYIAPDKFTGKHVEIRQARCFHADKNEFRCIASGSFALMILAADVIPPQSKDQLEQDCGQIKKITSPPCRKTIRFIPLTNTQDEVNAFSKRTVVLTRSIEIVSSSRKR